MDIFTIGLWVITLIWFIYSIIKDKGRTIDAMKKSKGMMGSMLPQILGILFLIGLILTLIPPEMIKNYLGGSNPLLATVISALAGSITLIPAFVASDLLSQAEHGADSQVILVSTSKKLIDAVELEIQIQLDVLPRKEIAEKAIANSKLIFVENDKIALELINEYGPEHFIICSEFDDFYCNGIYNAGSVFIGNYTPESAGDYASGTNHTLPTNGYAKNYSGVNLDSFTKAMTFQKISKKGIQNIGKAIEVMAEAEGLQAHKNAVTLRLKAIENEK